jgi:hypothetical protein
MARKFSFEERTKFTLNGKSYNFPNFFLDIARDPSKAVTVDYGDRIHVHTYHGVMLSFGYDVAKYLGFEQQYQQWLTDTGAVSPDYVWGASDGA